MSNIKIVAEIGCNHNGDIELAKKMIREAQICGADAVKFQTFCTEELVSVNAPKAQYQRKCGDENDSQFEMLKALELTQSAYLDLLKYAQSIDMEIFSTPFDLKSIQFLASIGQKIWKIPSGEINNLPYLEMISSLPVKKKTILLSTGMATLNEIEKAIQILNREENQIIILHCNTDYPTPDEDMNLRVILGLQEHFTNFKIGLSDHSMGYTAALTACGMGICYIEKHFTLNRNMQGPDHKASIEPIELQALCKELRRAQVMLGKKEKHITNSEYPNRRIARKSIVARTHISIGDVFTEDNITCKRPGNGISPMYWHTLLGRTAETNFSTDELITHTDFPWEE